ncbi:MAG TPA: Ku protein [Gallionella sp.]|nr:Ku protein [Gallionella sp.]
MKKDDTDQVQIEDEEEQQQSGAFWSGIIAFGLVSLPVSLLPAARGKVALKMVDANGALLKRQFFCEQDKHPLELDDVVRSYEIEKYHYVVVEDEELEALEPKRSREIDLKRFVPLRSINPVYFERAYYLVPDSDTTKAYRLLAKSMEDEQKAGIASFVMRGKDYLVAILASGGILRAETLRFHDELRTPDQVGLPPRQHADDKLAEQMRAAIGKTMRKRFDSELLSDQQARNLMQHIEQKLKSGTGVLKAPEEPESSEAAGNVVDLMQVLKERLQGRQPGPSKPAHSTSRESKHKR